MVLKYIMNKKSSINVNILDPRYNALQYNMDSVITRLRSWTQIFQGLAKAA